MRIFRPALCAVAGATASMIAGSANAADVTCATTAYSGLVCVTADGITTYGKGNSPLRSGRANDVAACGDKIAVLSYRKIYLFDGKSFGKPIDIVGTYARRISCDTKGNIWTLGSKEAASWDGKGWKVHTREKMFGEDAKKAGFLGQIAVGPDGKAIVLGSRMAAYYDGKAWKVYKQGQGFENRAFVSRVYYDSKGGAWIAGIRGLMMLKGDKWERLGGARGTSFVTGNSDGGVIWVGGGRSIFKVDDGRVSRMRVPFFVRDGAVDADGRLWVATNYGIAVLTGDKWETRQMHNSDLMDNSLSKIASVGKGGTLPAAKEQSTGTIKGRLEWSDGSEIKNARMQLCGSPSWLIRRGSSPCEGKPLAYDTKTNDAGRFEVKDVKAAMYRIAIKPEGNTRWVLISLGRRGQVLPGKTKNTGTIRVSTRSRK